MSAPRLILASRSPRRATLLRQAKYGFEQTDPPFEDPAQPTNPDGRPVEQFVAQLAVSKALSVIETLSIGDRPGWVVLAADTVCVGNDGRLIGKPATLGQARQMIRSFIDDTHRVVTGVAVVGDDADGQRQIETAADAAEVRFGSVDRGQVNEYVETDQWRGKAGGYNLLDRQQAGWPITVDGDPTTVVGLPMTLVTTMLGRRSIYPIGPVAATELLT